MDPGLRRGSEHNGDAGSLFTRSALKPPTKDYVSGSVTQKIAVIMWCRGHGDSLSMVDRKAM
jgi:hypothetical protein